MNDYAGRERSCRERLALWVLGQAEMSVVGEMLRIVINDMRVPYKIQCLHTVSDAVLIKMPYSSKF